MTERAPFTSAVSSAAFEEGVIHPAERVSASTTVTRAQALTISGIAAVAGLAFLFAPLGTATALIAVATLIYMTALVYRVATFWSAIRRPSVICIPDEAALAIPDSELPVYTVLVPAYREPTVIAGLISRLAELDYPREKLDIRLLFEEDDVDTIAAAIDARPGPEFTIVFIPDSKPKTKPKACNVGLAGARGELVTIYDAEDRPDTLQLRKAAAAFAMLDERVICLQAKLSYYNHDQNMLTRWFTVEYGMWFSNLLPGLVSQRGPLPLGGTSNHFRMEVLRELGGWDPFNVTEDADLGIRLARYGYQTAVLDSTTLEEANSDVINWIRQRSRWYKGYIQTWLVHMREPRGLLDDLGLRGFVGFQLFIGGTPLLALMNPIFWAMTALWFLVHPAAIMALFPAWLYYLGLVAMVAGNVTLFYSWLVSARIAGSRNLVFAALITPAYWMLMSLAAAKAAVQLINAPSFWEKTVHGLDQAPAEGSPPEA